MKRPEIIVVLSSSLDGRITTAPGQNVSEWTALGLDGDANDIAHRVCDDLDCDGMISGSETLSGWGEHPVP